MSILGSPPHPWSGWVGMGLIHDIVAHGREKLNHCVVVTHNSVHVVEKVFVGCNIVCVVGADHVLYDVSDERHLLV